MTPQQAVGPAEFDSSLRSAPCEGATIPQWKIFSFDCRRASANRQVFLRPRFRTGHGHFSTFHWLKQVSCNIQRPRSGKHTPRVFGRIARFHGKEQGFGKPKDSIYHTISSFRIWRLRAIRKQALILLLVLLTLLLNNWGDKFDSFWFKKLAIKIHLIM